MINVRDTTFCAKVNGELQLTSNIAKRRKDTIDIPSSKVPTLPMDCLIRKKGIDALFPFIVERASANFAFSLISALGKISSSSLLPNKEKGNWVPFSL